MRKIILASLFALFILNLGAQTRYRERIDTVAVSGYYNIGLSQPLAGLSRYDNLDDVRILDSKGVEVPFLVRPSSPVYETSRMKMFGIKTSSAKDSLNRIVIENPAQDVIGRVYVTMRGADVAKWVSMRGSDDLRQWFVVKQRMALYSQTGSADREVAAIDFPAGNYRYYEILISNSQNSPLDITGVGRMESSSIYGQFEKIDYKGFEVRRDVNNNTIIAFPNMPYPYRIAKIDIGVTDKTLYRREAAIFTGDSRAASLTLSHNSDDTFYLDELRIDSTATIRIVNQGNQPLDIGTIRMFGLSR